MAEISGGLRRPLNSAFVYGAVQRALGADEVRRRFVDDHVRPVAGAHMLDIGCGPGDILQLLPDLSYVGIDLSPAYIDAARRRSGARGEFICGDIRNVSLGRRRAFDLVVSIGVLHHLDDRDVTTVGRLASDHLNPDGRLVTLDPCLAADQARMARWLIRHDRGRNVRTPEGYRRLLSEHFGDVDAVVHHDLARVPYSHVALECRSPQQAG